MTFDKILQYNL